MFKIIFLFCFSFSTWTAQAFLKDLSQPPPKPSSLLEWQWVSPLKNKHYASALRYSFYLSSLAPQTAWDKYLPRLGVRAGLSWAYLVEQVNIFSKEESSSKFMWTPFLSVLDLHLELPYIPKLTPSIGWGLV